MVHRGSLALGCHYPCSARVIVEPLPRRSSSPLDRVYEKGERRRKWGLARSAATSLSTFFAGAAVAGDGARHLEDSEPVPVPSPLLTHPLRSESRAQWSDRPDRGETDCLCVANCPATGCRLPARRLRGLFRVAARLKIRGERPIDLGP